MTLLELLIVISIIGVLMLVLLPNLVTARRASQDRTAQAFIYQVALGVEARRSALGELPAAGDCTLFTSLPARPSSVSDCRYEPDHDELAYTITVEAVTGNVFQRRF